MFGAYVRAALTIPIAVIVAGVLEFAIPFFLPLIGPTDSLLYRSFDFLANNALFIMLVAVAAGVLARAYIESGPQGV